MLSSRSRDASFVMSCALFGAILLAFVVAVILLDPLSASVLP